VKLQNILSFLLLLFTTGFAGELIDSLFLKPVEDFYCVEKMKFYQQYWGNTSIPVYKYMHTCLYPLGCTQLHLDTSYQTVFYNDQEASAKYFKDSMNTEHLWIATESYVFQPPDSVIKVKTYRLFDLVYRNRWVIYGDPVRVIMKSEDGEHYSCP
jgi:hypothetical protein